MKTLCKLCTLYFILMSIALSSRPTEVFAATSDPAFSQNESSLHFSYLPAISYSEDGYRSSFRVFNPSASEATITWTAYNDDGSIAISNVDSIPASSGRDYWPMPDSTDVFTGSVVIAADQPIGAISTLHSHDGSSIASYTGATGGENKVYLPYLLKNVNGYDTWYSVQNTGSSPANITIEYHEHFVIQATIPAGASKRFYQDDERHIFGYAMGIVTSDQPIVATVIATNGSLASAYNGSYHPVTEVSFPTIETEYASRVTLVVVRNVGESDTDITVTYRPNSGGEPCVETHSIAPLSRGSFEFNQDYPEKCELLDPTVGPGHITENSAEQSVTSVVNQIVYHEFYYEQAARASYAPIAPADATDTVVMPLIMDRVDGYYTRFSVQHVGGPAAIVTCTFSDSDRVVELALDEWESLQDNQWNQIGDQYTGSAICQADNNETRIIAVATQENLCSETDQIASYEGIIGSSSTITISPSVDDREPYAPLWLDATYCVLSPPTDPTVGVIAGNIVNTTGRPLAQSTVVVYYQDDNDEWVVANSQEVDQDGNYRITLDSPVSTYRLGYHWSGFGFYQDVFFYGDTYAIEEATDVPVNAGETTAINLVIEEIGLLGKVTDSNGTPLENVELTISGVDPAGNPIPSRATSTTDADGNYTISNMLDGVYRVQAMGYDYYLDASVGGLTIRHNHQITANITLETGGRIEGTIDSESSTLNSNRSDFRVYGQNDVGEWEVVQQGFYTDREFNIRLAPGTYRLQFLAMPGERTVNTFYGDTYLLEDATDIVVTSGQTITIEQTMGQYSAITGKVVDSSGQPLSNITVRYYWKDVDGEWRLSSSILITNLNGGYHTGNTRVDPGLYKLDFYVDYTLVKTVSDIAVGLSEVVEVDAVIDSVGHVAGQLTDSLGVPIPGAMVIAYTHNADGEWEQISLSQTDAEGNYLIQNLLEGIYRIKFDPGSSQAYLTTFYGNTESIEEATDVSVTSGQTTMNVHIAPFETNWLMGKVTDRANNPLSEIAISLYKKNEEGEWEYFYSNHYTQTDLEGNYIFHNLPNGLYRIEVRGHDYYLDASIENLEIVENQRTVADVILETGGRIEGTANTNGHHFAMDSIHIYSRNDDGVWEQVGREFYEEGEFSIRIAEGTYRLKFIPNSDSPGYVAETFYGDTFYGDTFVVEEATDVTVVNEEVTSIKMVLTRGAEITGLVTDYTGVPVSGLRITLYEQDEQGEWIVKYTRNNTTDSEGRYTISRLGAGPYRIGFRNNGESQFSAYSTTFYSSAFDLESATDIMISRPETVTADFMINRLGTISGQVTDSDGVPLEYVDVEAYPNALCGGKPSLSSYWHVVARTDELGNYEMTVAPDTYSIRFNGGEEYQFQYYDQMDTIYEAQEFVVGLNQTVTGIDAQLQDISTSGIISGYVTSLDGQSLGSIFVDTMRYEKAEERWLEVDSGARTDDNGYYVITELISGTYRILFNEYIYWNYGNSIDYGSQYYGGGMANRP